MYKICYLPLALDDLKEILRYIAQKLEAPRAAENLLIKIEKDIQKIVDNPFRCPVYFPSEKLKHEYRVLHIDNYSMFYVIAKDKIEIHRVIYSQRDILRILDI
ncbi:MAG: type II toxin-antitoxin system RelE/ParE family toxin [Treponema sp.]|jgi:plasmid stabilization system protein ParE|nr:type II toxin-antitoxin system RelE/ParE family toxin [Treponema sp.]